MKPLFTTLLLASLFPCYTLMAQCILDVSYLKDSPQPCHFVGTVDFENSNCVDISQPDWSYRWSIREAGNGEMVAVYEGMAFDHVFEKFGGYNFCLEIYKDGNTNNSPSHYECVSYTTCEPCGDTDLSFNYQSCPIGEGCNLEFVTEIPAVNMVGLKDKANYVVTYTPTELELLGGAETYELEFENIDIEFHPDSNLIIVSEDLNVKFSRGCFTARLELELEEGRGAHYTYGGPPCTDLVIEGTEVFRCISCNEEGFGCTASIMATEVSNGESSCKLFACPIETDSRSTDFDTDTQDEPIPSFLSISPNPARTNVRVEVSNSHDNMTISILDAMGRVVATKNPNGYDSTDFDVSYVLPGLYMVIVRANGKVTHSEKLVIMH